MEIFVTKEPDCGTLKNNGNLGNGRNRDPFHFLLSDFVSMNFRLGQRFTHFFQSVAPGKNRTSAVIFGVN